MSQGELLCRAAHVQGGADAGAGREKYAALVYLFEVLIVVTIQAFVFALLSAIYIGGAIEPEH